jgi:hypothetical protein
MSGHIYGRRDFAWHPHSDGFALHVVGKREAVLHVVPDTRWPNMYRIRHPGGVLPDMANLTWAKDGAVALAMRMLDPRRKTEQTAPSGARNVPNGLPLLTIGQTRKPLYDPSPAAPDQPPSPSTITPA